MKRSFVTLVIAILFSYLLLGFQSTLHVLPFPAPALWVAIFCYISFFRSFFLALVFNFCLTIIICQFSVTDPASLILVLNGLSFAIKGTQNRFQLGTRQIAMSIGFFSLSISLGLFLTQNLGSYSPQLLVWLGLALSTAMFSPIVFYIFLRLDNIFPTDTLDSMELYLS